MRSVELVVQLLDPSERYSLASGLLAPRHLLTRGAVEDLAHRSASDGYAVSKANRRHYAIVSRLCCPFVRAHVVVPAVAVTAVALSDSAPVTTKPSLFIAAWRRAGA